MDGGTVIGENTGVFVGGLPQGYTILRKDSGEFGESIEFICCLHNWGSPGGSAVKNPPAI